MRSNNDDSTELKLIYTLLFGGLILLALHFLAKLVC